jgi:hypothetical protein
MKNQLTTVTNRDTGEHLWTDDIPFNRELSGNFKNPAANICERDAQALWQVLRLPERNCGDDLLRNAHFHGLLLLDRLHGREDGALRRCFAVDGERDLAAQNGLERRHWLGTSISVLLHDHGTIGLCERQLFYARAGLFPRPSGWIAGLALAKPLEIIALRRQTFEGIKAKVGLAAAATKVGNQSSPDIIPCGYNGRASGPPFRWSPTARRCTSWSAGRQIYHARSFLFPAHSHICMNVYSHI